MSYSRLLGLLVGVCLVAITARPADACGVWTMVDKEKRYDVKWLINSGTVRKAGRRVAALYLDVESKHAPRVVAGRKVVFDIRDGAIRKRGKRVGRITKDGSIVFGKRTYTVAFTEPKDYHGMPAWKLTVKRGEDVIVETDMAPALCVQVHRDPPLTEAQQQDTIRARVAFYLAWREVGL